MHIFESIFLDCFNGISQFCEIIGFFSLIRFFRRKRIIILMYHGITAQHHPVANFDGKHVEKEKFEKQLCHLKKKYTLISLNDYMDKKKTLPNNAVVLTFDDGYANLYTQILPILKKEKIPITIFIPTGYISKEQMGWYDKITYAISVTKEKSIIVNEKKYFLESEKQKCAAILELKINVAGSPEKREQIIEEVFKVTNAQKKTTAEDFCYLPWEQCKEMQEEGVIFGSHSVMHPLLTKEKERLKEELSESKKAIEKNLGKKCIVFAYPFGDYDNCIAEKTEAEGYICAVTTEYGTNTRKTNPFELRRIAINNLYSEKLFPLLLLCNFRGFHHSILVAYSKLRKVFH
jgi:peptidoglycan/xylan/chitin deacetylase (PgdA/CDA1 family)